MTPDFWIKHNLLLKNLLQPIKMQNEILCGLTSLLILYFSTHWLWCQKSELFLEVALDFSRIFLFHITLLPLLYLCSTLGIRHFHIFTMPLMKINIIDIWSNNLQLLPFHLTTESPNSFHDQIMSNSITLVLYTNPSRHIYNIFNVLNRSQDFKVI